jgi:hypothetical protein
MPKRINQGGGSAFGNKGPTGYALKIPTPAILREFALAYMEAEKPKDFIFEYPAWRAGDAISEVQKINRWRAKFFEAFADPSAFGGFNRDLANLKLKEILFTLTWDDLEALKIRLEPPVNQPAEKRKMILYVPRIFEFEKRVMKEEELLEQEVNLPQLSPIPILSKEEQQAVRDRLLKAAPQPKAGISPRQPQPETDDHETFMQTYFGKDN